VGEIRERRLLKVAAETGIDALILGGFPDSRLARVPVEEVGGAVRAVAEALRPQVIVGHDPRGVNAHPDHIASHWAIRHHLAGPRDREGGDVRFAMIVYRQEDADAIAPRLLFGTPEEEIDAVVRLTPEETRAKEACLRAHDALVTVVRDGPEGLLLRPPVERFDFLGEDHAPPLPDLFA
jgi:LmbE family N-acetylglucosaminyl deacetylase